MYHLPLPLPIALLIIHCEAVSMPCSMPCTLYCYICTLCMGIASRLRRTGRGMCKMASLVSPLACS
ncbi:hypothetical protein BX600DRAFT_471695 [Xylariales sp. PMI_506]|nr:hypothetical protein BX600DRAFT_471695 [Xylariales sp. PMI_506]